jgi:hypothetical protein
MYKSVTSLPVSCRERRKGHAKKLRNSVTSAVTAISKCCVQFQALNSQSVLITSVNFDILIRVLFICALFNDVSSS